MPVEDTLKNIFLKRLERMYYREPVPVSQIDWQLVHSILVIRQHDQLGDFLLSTPVFRALRHKFPDARIALVTREYFSEIAASIGFIDQVLTVPGPAARWNPVALYRFWKQLRSGWALAIVLNTVSHSLTSDLIAYYSRAPFVLGSGGGVFPGCRTNFFYNLFAPPQSHPRHQSEINMDIVREIGVDTDDMSEIITVPAEEAGTALALLRANGLNGKDHPVGIHIGAGKPENRWSPRLFAQLADRLRTDDQADVVVFRGPGEENLLTEFLAAVQTPPAVIEPSTLIRQAAFFANCSLVVCNDTGVLHLAAATGVPVLGLFGPTDPAGWMPPGSRHSYLRSATGNIGDLTVESVLQKIRTMQSVRQESQSGTMSVH